MKAKTPYSKKFISPIGFFEFKCQTACMKYKLIILLSLFLSSTLYARTLEITMVGDVGFNKSNQIPYANFVQAYEQNTPWSELTKNIAPYISGDLIFGNLETVVTDQALPSPGNKAYKFQSHPNSVVHLVENLGFNLFSLANNHAGDYGTVGTQSTLGWMNNISLGYSIHHHGLGTANEIIQPKVFETNGVRVAFLAIGIDAFGLAHTPATTKQIGSLNIHNSKHISKALANFKLTSADLKILSVHFGTEGSVRLDANQRTQFQSYVDSADADIVVGHHPHVVRPMEIYKGKLIIYSLGNFLLIGAANMDQKPISHSYGLVVKTLVDIKRNEVNFRQVTALPVQNTHFKPHALSNEAAIQRLGYLNGLSRQELGDNALIFKSANNYGIWKP